ncbi:unnamed protein product [Parascedosporium putredinis]|uniref:Uncharacterized protein n=1 Tax=Parascedosporium putredinis TaxID=1442378 RepID=A0A9P1GWT4_9PEZI|nr:unnamed protein product [Parascedosporium putredinis]CAI7989049.1 unnamed protein product [Parascedosporium putredinis]
MYHGLRFPPLSPDFETPQLFQKTPFEDGGTSRHSSSSWTSGPGNDISPFSSTAPVHAAESHRHFTAYTPVSTAGRTLSISSSASSAGSNPSTTPTAHAHSHPTGLIARPPARRRIPSILLNRPLSAGDIAARIASHATHFSPNPNLPTVDPSFRLSSSPLPLSNISREWSPEANDNDADDKSFQERARKGYARDRNTSAVGKQGDRKPPSGPTATTMQDDQGFGHPDFLGATATPHQQHSGDLTAAFAASGHDVFGYPLSAGAAPASYWDPSVSMTAMDLDFAQAAAQEGKALGPKPSRPSAEIPVSGDLAGPYLAGSDAAFTLSPSGGVDPGLLFSRPPSSGMDVSFNQAGHADPAETSRTRTCSAEFRRSLEKIIQLQRADEAWQEGAC